MSTQKISQVFILGFAKPVKAVKTEKTFTFPLFNSSFVKVQVDISKLLKPCQVLRPFSIPVYSAF